MRYLRFALIALVAVFAITGGAYAADIYKDTYTSEDSSGNWVFDGNVEVAGTFAATGNTTLSGTVTGKTAVTVINATADTVGTVTAAKSGYTFLSNPTSGSAFVLTLPTAADGLAYQFVNASVTTVSVQPASTANTIVYLALDLPYDADATTPEKITSPATVSSVTLVASSNVWYITDMTGTWTDGGA